MKPAMLWNAILTPELNRRIGTNGCAQRVNERIDTTL
jgi:hypothetical protein